jgi:hypothetical protein
MNTVEPAPMNAMRGEDAMLVDLFM